MLPHETIPIDVLSVFFQETMMKTSNLRWLKPLRVTLLVLAVAGLALPIQHWCVQAKAAELVHWKPGFDPNASDLGLIGMISRGQLVHNDFGPPKILPPPPTATMPAPSWSIQVHEPLQDSLQTDLADSINLKSINIDSLTRKMMTRHSDTLLAASPATHF